MRIGPLRVQSDHGADSSISRMQHEGIGVTGPNLLFGFDGIPRRSFHLPAIHADRSGVPGAIAISGNVSFALEPCSMIRRWGRPLADGTEDARLTKRHAAESRRRAATGATRSRATWVPAA